MPLSPELKILDLIIEAANEVRKENPLSTGVAFSHFSKRLAEMKRELNDEGSTHLQETGGEAWPDWMVEFEKKHWGNMFECGDYEALVEHVGRLLSLAEAKGAEKERERVLKLLEREEIEEVASYERKLEGRPSRQLQEQVDIELPVVKSIYAIIKKAITPPTP